MPYLDDLRLINLPLHRQFLLSRVKMRWLGTFPVKIRKILYYGTSRYCPVCLSYLRGFQDFGHIPEAWCPVCFSMPRHRLIWLFFQQHTSMFDGTPKRMLHVAPEPAFEERFKKIVNLDYITADLQNPHCMVRMDITDIGYPNDTFDVIYCSHVLEHVSDDRAAMREFVRVLKPDGFAVLLVPIREKERTIEDPTVVSPAEREHRFGQHDHVRNYGPDFKDRLEEAGFEVHVFRTGDIISMKEAVLTGISDRNFIFMGRKSCGTGMPFQSGSG